MGPFSLAAAAALSLIGAPAPGACGEDYTVVRHDTLYSIARRCGFGVGAIARANRIDPTRIEVGQRLLMPGREQRGVRRRVGRALVYRFQHGDTLYSLARWARTDLRALLAANPSIDPRDIDAGAAVLLPAGAVPPEPARLRERGAPPLPRVVIPPMRFTRQPGPPRAAPPPPRDDNADDDEGKPAGDANIPEDEEPEGL